MDTSKAYNLARLAQSQAIDAVNVVQRGGIRNDDDRYRENLALALANLSQAVMELTKG